MADDAATPDGELSETTAAEAGVQRPSRRPTTPPMRLPKPNSDGDVGGYDG